MKDCLVVLNPRRIGECLAAFLDLPIDKLWVKNMCESDIKDAWPSILEMTAGYDRLLVSSDDGIPRPCALDTVTGLLDLGHPVVTGYSNLAANDYRVNIAKARHHDHPSEATHTFYTLAELMESRDATVPTLVVGFTLTGMAHDLWARYPFDVYNEYPGNASDFMLSMRLEKDEVPMVAARDAFVWHVKENWNRPDTDDRKRLYLNERSELVLERQDPRAPVISRYVVPR